MTFAKAGRSKRDASCDLDRAVISAAQLLRSMAMLQGGPIIIQNSNVTKSALKRKNNWPQAITTGKRPCVHS